MTKEVIHDIYFKCYVNSEGDGTVGKYNALP